MAAMISSQSHALKLVMEQRSYVSGEHITGMVEFDTNIGQAEQISSIKVTLHGTVTTHIPHRVKYRKLNGRRETYTCTVDEIDQRFLVHEESDLWVDDTKYRNSTSVLRLPFDFVLPESLPSSFRAGSVHRGARGAICYTIKVEAKTHGSCRRKKRIKRVLCILERASAEDVAQVLQLRQGWQGPWTENDNGDCMKQSWDDGSRVELHLLRPAISAFPVGIPIPIAIIVVTFSKPMKRSVTPDHAFDPKSNQQLFPAPPTDPSKLDLVLHSNVHISARGMNHEILYKLESLGGFGRRASKVATSDIQWTVAEPEWVPGENDEGCWRREVRYDSFIKLWCTPAITLSHFRYSHDLGVVVPLPGTAGDLEWRMPIIVHSGVTPSSQGILVTDVDEIKLSQ